MRRRISVAIAGVTVAALAGACGGGGNTPGQGSGPAEYETDGTFTLAMTSDPGAVDPYRNVLSLAEMGGLAYDSLVNRTPDGDYVSGLAQEWEVGPDNVSFTLVDGATCSDGSPMTATQVAAALDFVKDPANASILYGLLVPTTPFTVTADDAAGTVDITMDQPFSFLLETIGQVPIMCEEGLANPDRLDKETFGTGPFELTEVVAGDHYTFTRRDDYVWGADGATTDVEGMPKTVVMKIVPNETTAANLLLSGEVNMANILGADRDRLTAQGLVSLDIRSTMGELWFNQREGRVAAEDEVRLALTAALDLDELTAVSTSGNGERATGLVANDGDPCRTNTVEGHLPEFDVDAAATMLDDAGWVLEDGVRTRDGKPLSIDLHYTPSDGEGGVAAAELVAEKWKDLGVEVDLTSDSLNALNSTMFETGDFDAYWAGFKFSLPYQVVPFVSGGLPPAEGTNFTGIDNPDYVELANEAGQTPGAEGCELWNQAEQALFDSADAVPVSDVVAPYFLSGAEAETDGWLHLPIPTSIRVLK
jgi:peptide/nickel transport system substrate-binding protein